MSGRIQKSLTNPCSLQHQEMILDVVRRVCILTRLHTRRIRPRLIAASIINYERHVADGTSATMYCMVGSGSGGKEVHRQATALVSICLLANKTIIPRAFSISAPTTIIENFRYYSRCDDTSRSRRSATKCAQVS
jgi:hypothetical protein